LLVLLGFRSSHKVVRPMLANFGIGALDERFFVIRQSGKFGMNTHDKKVAGALSSAPR
jgi:hypothetical protein